MAAVESKNKGNEAVARKDFGAAEAHYTKGIEQLGAPAPGDAEAARLLAVLYSNRAQARISMKKRAADAVADCTAALDVCPGFLKSHLRRAVANAQLGNYDDASADIVTLQGKGDDALASNGIDRAAVDDLGAEFRREAEAALARRREQMGERELCAEWVAGLVAEAPAKRHRLPSGVVFEVVRAGDAAAGRSPTEGTECSVHYEGKLRDGSVFDSSIARGEPTSFAPSQVIPAWNEVLQYMAEGDVWMIWAPYDTAYGKRGHPPAIPGFATLQFEIRLEKVVDTASSKPGEAGRAALARAMGAADASKFIGSA